MLLTKSIQSLKEERDGIRISIMRRPRGDYDIWMPVLAPSDELLDAYHDGRIDWNEYERKFLISISQQPAIEKIIDWLIDNAQTHVITLLCWELEPEKCHRRLVAQWCHAKSNALEVNIK